ncbi:MAG: hypothetical protein ACN6OB_07795 [Chryseobacterium jejuense]|uniref:hypothetical protein n=1 Tax=Chryseobacterium jejuense TaxID=445960 RepID=UPI003D14AF7E
MPVQNNVGNSNAFFDASTNFNTTASSSNSIGKGLVFPDTDLTKFKFDMTLADGITFPSYFDGMLVYNTGTGATADPLLTVQTTGLAPGWYYFSNPNGAGNGSVAAGKWLPLGASPKVTIGTAETTTNTLVNVSPGVDKQVYAIKGSFSASGTSTAVNIPAPSGMTTMYAITIYKSGSGVVYDRSLYSYNVVATAGNAITGSPNMSVVYPNGTYDYVLEYLK